MHERVGETKQYRSTASGGTHRKISEVDTSMTDQANTTTAARNRSTPHTCILGLVYVEMAKKARPARPETGETWPTRHG
jgi:hypothetical protein